MWKRRTKLEGEEEQEEEEEKEGAILTGAEAQVAHDTACSTATDTHASTHTASLHAEEERAARARAHAPLRANAAPKSSSRFEADRGFASALTKSLDPFTPSKHFFAPSPLCAFSSGERAGITEQVSGENVGASGGGAGAIGRIVDGRRGVGDAVTGAHERCPAQQRVSVVMCAIVAWRERERRGGRGGGRQREAEREGEIDIIKI
jgi:hypothetical protein